MELSEQPSFVRVSNDLKAEAASAINKGRLEKAMACIEACARMNYEINQQFKDDQLEKYILDISQKICSNDGEEYIADNHVVAFYDGFGYDLRGLAYIYLKALISLGKKVIYIVGDNAKNQQPKITELIQGNNVIRVYISMKSSHRNHIENLLRVLYQHKPSTLFFYSLPKDVSGVIAFMKMKNKAVRFQINLTDHAFWLGINMFDYSIEFRDYGASISSNYRGIERERIIKLPFYPYFDENIPFQGLPFDYQNKQFVFSGGDLYKTFDKDLTYYQIVRQFLADNPEIFFVYAGNGDTTELDKLKSEYHEQVYHLPVRTDLYQIMKRSLFYLNTFPMAGGLMTQFAVIAGKVPLLLVQGNDSDGILMNQNTLGIEFSSKEGIIAEMNQLAGDREYLSFKETSVQGSVITDIGFAEELGRIIDHNQSSYDIEYKDINVEEMRMQYLLRFNFSASLVDSVATLKNKSLFFQHPGVFWDGFTKKIAQIIRNGKN